MITNEQAIDLINEYSRRLDDQFSNAKVKPEKELFQFKVNIDWAIGDLLKDFMNANPYNDSDDILFEKWIKWNKMKYGSLENDQVRIKIFEDAVWFINRISYFVNYPDEFDVPQNEYSIYRKEINNYCE